MKVVFNSYNTLSAGTSNVSRFILKAFLRKSRGDRLWFFLPRTDAFAEISHTPGVRIVKLAVLRGPMNWVLRAIFDFVIFPVSTWFIKPDAVVVLANYSPVAVWGRKVVFLRHPQLVEPDAGRGRYGTIKILEGLRRANFLLTLRTTDIIAVQSDYMKTRLLENYSVDADRVVILPNPVSNFWHGEKKPPRDQSGNDSKIVLYVSRFYPHKNHEFLLTLVERFQDRLRQQGVRFYITVSPDQVYVDPQVSASAERFIRLIESKALSDVLINIGEIAHEQLVTYYQEAACFFFPSRSETFGNPLVEAMFHHLPVVVPDLAYARAVCGDAGVYFRPEDPDEAFKKIMTVLTDTGFRANCAEKSGAQANAFPTADEWIETLFSTIDKQPGHWKQHGN